MQWTYDAFFALSMNEPKEVEGPGSFPGIFSVVAGEGQASPVPQRRSEGMKDLEGTTMALWL